MDESLDRRLEEIERRLTTIETSLHALIVPSPAHPAVPPPLHPPALPKRPTVEAMEQKLESLHANAIPVIPIPVSPPPATDQYAENMREMWSGPSPTSASVPLTPPRSIPPRPVRAPVAAKPGGSSFEQTIGLKWAGWIGAVVLVIGAGLGFKYAYDQGWLGSVPPIARIGLLAMIGVALLAAGEWVYRRVNQMSAAGFFGAGTAVLFLASYAGHAWYGLYIDKTAIALMGASALVGILVAARADLVSVAVLAIIGGNIGPLLLGSKSPTIAPFLTYLLLLQVMALGLCAWQAKPKWWSLRGLTLATTTFWLLALGVTGHPQASTIGMAFAVVFAALFQFELCFSTIRQARQDPSSPPGTAPGLIFSLLVTAALAGGILLLEQRASSRDQGIALLILAAATAIAGLILNPFRSVGLSGVALSFRIQSVLLLILAIPVMLTGPSLLFGWMLLAVGLAVLSAATGRKLAMAGAVLTWALAIVFGTAWALFDSNSQSVWLTLFGEALQARLIVAACLALAGHVLAAATRRLCNDPVPSPFATAPIMLLDIVAITVLSAALFLFTSPDFATICGIAYAVILFACSFTPFWANLGVVAIVLLSVVAMKWAALDVLQPQFGKIALAPQPLLLNLQAAIGAALAICFGAMGWIQSRRQIDSAGPDAAARTAMAAASVLGLAILVASFTLTMEVQRYWLIATHAGGYTAWPGTGARDLLWTILWSACLATWLFAARAVAREPSVRNEVLRVALIVSLLLVGKFILFDVLIAYTNHPAPTAAIGLNIQVLAGFAVLALISSVIALARRTPVAWFAERCVLVVPLLLLVIGSAEIDRYAMQQTHGPTWMVRQVGWSIYWSGLAVVLLIVGFARHLKALRVAALGLLGITLVKVTLVDLSTAGSGWRILSFLGLGLLLLATSVLYGKFSHGMTSGDRTQPD